MDAARWQRLSPLLDELLELPGALRAQRLLQLADHDPDLARQLRALLQMEHAAGDFLDGPLLAAAAPHFRTGDRIGAYRLVALLGEGGSGQVWHAEHLQRAEPEGLALKLLHRDCVDAEARRRFLREKEILESLSHPGIVEIVAAGATASDQPYLVLKRVCGEAITDHCRRLQLALPARIALFLQVCEAVAHAHGRGVVHGDLKPANILVTAQGRVKLLDFGIAVCACAGDAAVAEAFTLHYAAPEQIRGEGAQPCSDLYALGVLLYELVTDRKPYRLRRHSDAEWEKTLLSLEIEPPSLAMRCARSEREPAAAAMRLDAIVLQALQPQTARRQPSVDALAAQLRAYLESRSSARGWVSRLRQRAWRIGG
ncbi:MAG TPA: hypothetical protein DDZ67_05870 [Xanthomonadaceae bacterium]|nr:hypothetical protein [Xanthomonadaceae bacterium]